MHGARGPGGVHNSTNLQELRTTIALQALMIFPLNADRSGGVTLAVDIVIAGGRSGGSGYCSLYASESGTSVKSP